MDEQREDDEAQRATEAVDAPESPVAGALDLGAVRADDALLDALGGADPDVASLSSRSTGFGDPELAALLLSWRQETDSEPIGELVDVDTAVRVLAAAKARPARRRHRVLIPVASAAAVLAIAFGGVSVAAKDAHPGDTLWGLTQVLYADHARSIVAAAAVRTQFDAARIAMSSGHRADALAALSQAAKTLPTVQPDDGRNDLQTTRQQLLDEVTGVSHMPGTSDTSAQQTPTMTTSPTSPVTSTTSPPPSSGTPTTTSQPPSTSPTTTTAPSDTKYGTQSGGPSDPGVSGSGKVPGVTPGG
ncbi:MAG: anti-sigma-D factor RsdA [Sciscionella sp.]